VLRLTVEPDGNVSMCALQESDVDAPDLAAQLMDCVKTINFGAKEGVQAATTRSTFCRRRDDRARRNANEENRSYLIS
jgi:hypothetical protein